MALPSVISIVDFHKEIRRGSSLPLVVAGSDGHLYVAKLYGSGEGILASAIEYLCLRLGKLLDIPVLEPVFLTLGTGQITKNIDPEIRELMERSVGINFGTPYVESSDAFDARRVDPVLSQTIFLFDLFLLNFDRTHTNPNMIFSGRKLYVLDFSSAIAIRGCLQKMMYDETSLLCEMKRHLFYEPFIETDHFIGGVKSISNREVEKIVDELPEAWLSAIQPDQYPRESKICESIIRNKNNVGIIRDQLERMRNLTMEPDSDRRGRQLAKKEEFVRRYNLA